MGLWTRQRWGWEKPEWVFFGLIFGLLLLHPALNGYPFLFGDSWVYCCECPNGLRSPVLGCLMRPAVLAAGNWGFVVLQCAVTALVFAFLSGTVLKREHRCALIVSLLVSGAGIFAGFILADIWALIGLICLFAMAAGHAFPAIALLLALACATHFGNFAIFSAVALLVVPLVREKAKFALRASVCIVAALFLVVAANLLGGALKLSPGNGSIFLASRILHDMPEVLEDICRDDPESGLCPRKEEVRKWNQEDPGSFPWVVSENLGIGFPELSGMSQRIIAYSLSRFPGYYPAHLAAAARNTARLFSFYELSDGHVPFSQDPYVLESMQVCFFKDSDAYLKSWQGGGQLQDLLRRLDAPLTALFWLSALICLASAVACRHTRHADALIQLATFALIAVALNAFFMSNLSGVFGRYHTRVGFLLIFPGVALACRWTSQLARRAPLFRLSSYFHSEKA